MAPEAAAVPRFGVAPFVWEGVPCVAAGTGYTGEDGVEWPCRPTPPTPCGRRCSATGVQPAGLGARDTLRLEAGLPLHGHELGPGITPLQAGLGWVVGWDKEHFRGRDALVAERPDGVAVAWSGLATEGRQPPREGGTVVDDGRPVGTVTSGNFSPMLEHGIALAFVDAAPRRGRHGTGAGHRAAGPGPGRPGGRRRRSSGPASGPSPDDRRPGLALGPGAVPSTRHEGTDRPRSSPMGTYIPHTDDEVASMLAFLGLSTVDELFAVVPEALRLQRGLELADGVGEPDVLAHMEGFADRNRARSDRLVCFAGGGAYDHEIPSVTRALAGRSEFVTSYTPYQPEVAQGVLQAVFEYQTMVARLAGLPVANASLYDGGSAAVEAVNLGVAASGRQTVWVSAGIHPHWRQMLATGGPGHRPPDPDRPPGRRASRPGPTTTPATSRPAWWWSATPTTSAASRTWPGPGPCATGPGPCWWSGPTRWPPACSGRRASGGPTWWWGRARCSGPPSASAAPTSGCSPAPRPTCAGCPAGWWGRPSTSRAGRPT